MSSDELVFERRIELPDMIAYAGATWDWHRLHYDSSYLASRGLDRPVVDGQVFGAYLAIALREWFGPDVVIDSLAFRFKNLVFAGETIRCVGRPSVAPSVSSSKIEVDLRVEVVEDGRIAVAPASATLTRP
jgi:acyl dehydratase